MMHSWGKHFHICGRKRTNFVELAAIQNAFFFKENFANLVSTREFTLILEAQSLQISNVMDS